MTATLYSKPSITDLELGYAADAAANGWGPECYRYIERFERDFAAHLGVRHCIATSSCTGALHMGLKAVGVGLGDEVIMADVNWVASAAPVTYLGATPVLVDVERDSWCLDPAKVEAAITPLTRAIVAVHLYGNPCDLDRLAEIGARHNLPIIEDAAEGIGSTWRGRPVGGHGAFGVFSFHGTKTITTGEGGMFATDDDGLADRVRTLANHGRSSRQTKHFWPDEIGFKYKMSNLQAAIGCGQLERVTDLVARKRQIFELYRAALADLPLRMNAVRPLATSGYWMPTVIVDGAVDFDRDALLSVFRDNGIDARPFFYPLSATGLFERRFLNPISYDLSQRGLNLPSYHDITEAQMSRVVEVLRDQLTGAGATRPADAAVG